MAAFSKKLLALGFLFALALGGCASLDPAIRSERPTPQIETAQSIIEVQTVADDLAGKYGADDVLVVFDIDDTLLANMADLGSTAWWNWQSSLDTSNPDKIPFDSLLAANGVMFAVSDMKPAEGQSTLDVFRHLTSAGFAVYALTARGPDNRDATLRELHDQGLDFTTAPECGAPLCVKRGQLNGDAFIVPLARKRFGFETLASSHNMGAGTIKISSHRNASISDGVMMVAGQNKGVMLRLLVDSLPKADRPKAIIFVDDSAKNVADLKAASPAFPETLRIIHYEAQTRDQTDFMTNRARQNKAMDDLRKISKTLCTVLNNQAQVCER